jgi:peptide/nickel transport system substrate-binding protein
VRPDVRPEVALDRRRPAVVLEVRRKHKGVAPAERLHVARSRFTIVIVRIVAIPGLALAAVAMLGASAQGSKTASVKEGGTLRVEVQSGVVDTIDPALIDYPAEVQLLAPACATLMAYPDKAPPAGLRLQPDLAASDPTVSKNGRVYRFTIRRGLRFSTGAAVTAAAFAHALERLLSPSEKLQSPAAQGLVSEVVGASAFYAGSAKTLRGVIAKGRTLTISLTKRDPAFLDGLTEVCAVPPSLPADPQGAGAPLPSPAPYYVSEYLPGSRLVLKRNSFYVGSRPHHLDGVVADLGADANAAVDDVADGSVDWSDSANALRLRAGEIAARFGVNKGRFFVKPGPFLRMFVLNTSRPLFRNNPKLRQAVNFAVDRAALTRELGPLSGSPSDQYLSSSTAGYRNVRIYPLKGPDLTRARALAKGHLRSGQAVLYTRDEPEDIGQAQILQRNLKAIGLSVKIVVFPSTLIFQKLAAGRAQFDIGRIAWGHTADPSWFARIFDGRTLGTPANIDYSYFYSPEFNRLFDQAARLSGDARVQAYGALDVQISRDAAPAIPIANLNAMELVGPRVGCIVINPFLDLTAICLK